jgi:hypothetical protein
VILHLDALVFAQLDFRHHFELGLELQRRAVVEMNVGDIGTPDHIEVFRFHLLLQKPRNQVLEDLLPDVAFELQPDLGRGGFTRAEPRQLGALLNVRDHTSGLGFHLLGRNGNLQCVLAPFY